MGRRPPGAEVSNATHHSGAYACVLQRVCKRELPYDGSLALTDASAEELAADEREYRERLAALVRERFGQPVTCYSSDLPSGLPAPFENWPRRERQRRFVVDRTDTITLVTREDEGNGTIE